MENFTLAIDFGSVNIGLALVCNRDGVNEPLFAGIITYSNEVLKKKSNPRAQIRRLRRTRKTKKSRLNRLRQALFSLGLDQDVVNALVHFCRRRGYKALYGADREAEENGQAEETVFRYSREEFFRALNKEIDRLLPQDLRPPVLKVCDRVLNRHGELNREIRPIRIDNRGASRCAWSECDKVPPRRKNAIRDALAQFVYAIIDLPRLRNDENLHRDLDAALDTVAELAKRLRSVNGHDPDREKKVLRKRIREALKPVKDLAALDTWKVNSENIMNLLEKSQGRNRYCREHSGEYVRCLLEGRTVPFKASLVERDMVSRREEILYQKLWRYIETRILPLAPGGIDRLVVERVAFDLLAGTRKQRQKVGDKTVEESYQFGPRHGFKSDLEMLRQEFDGLCAYCGKPSGQIIQREHILPRGDFLFDSYLNILPSCPACNQVIKAKASPQAAGLHVHESAYQAYCRYLAGKFKIRPPHEYHTIKKGLLNLMRQPDRTWEAEQYLALIAGHFTQVAQTQRAPRPMARFLCERLRQRFGRSPQLAFRNGRHTDLWRRAAYPDFDKLKEKEEGGLINHALDALVLACDLPGMTALEGLNLKPKELKSWVRAVTVAAPPPGPDGVPVAPEPGRAVPGFEEILPGNYLRADLTFFNWNRKDLGVQSQDIYGWSKNENVPTKRKTALDLVAELRKQTNTSGVKKIIDTVAHPNLRQALQAANTGDKPGEQAVQALIDWLRRAIKPALDKARFSDHPGDQARRKALHDFVSGNLDGPPVTIGVKRLYPYGSGKTDLQRIDPKTGRLVHRYIADPANKALIAAYPLKKGRIRRDSPIILEVRQNDALKPQGKTLARPASGPLAGRGLGRPAPDPDQWKAELHRCLAEAGVAEYAVVAQGCVVKYEDGSEKYIRNFSTSQGFKNGFLKNIVAVRRSPFAAAETANVRLF